MFAAPLFFVAVACSVTSTTNGPVTSSVDSGAQQALEDAAVTSHDAAVTSQDAATNGSEDAGSDGAQPAQVATLEIDNAIYENKKSSSGGYYYGVNLSLKNVSPTDVTSLETLSFDFGGGKEVHLTDPACSGSFPISAGKSAPLQIQIVVDAASGSLTAFSFICGPSQDFGGATGSAPTSDTFTSPIALKAGGTTTDGTFEATGSATHVDNLP